MARTTATLAAITIAIAQMQTIAAAARAAAPRPNIVFLLADDFGYGDLASFGNPDQEPGHLDEMVAGGMRMRQWYAAESLCTPSRAASMTGRLPVRLGMIPPKGSNARVLSTSSTGGLPRDETTLAEMLHGAGYRTGVVGKWHLGINANSSDDGVYLPKQRGFDHSGLLLPFSNHWACDEDKRHVAQPSAKTCLLYHNDTLLQQPIDHSNLTENMAADAAGFIRDAARRQREASAKANAAEAAAQQPFFLYFGFPQCHVNMFNNPRWANSSRNGIFGSNIREMDWAAGQVLTALKDEGLLEAGKTIVFFTSDHGPHIELCLEGGRTGGLRGGKSYSSWEGGTRVPGAVYWPGVVAPGQVSDALASSMDIFATAAELAGVGAASGAFKPLDGVSLVPLLRAGTGSGVSPRGAMSGMAGSRSTVAAAASAGNTLLDSKRALFHYCAHVLMAVRLGDYKLKFWSETLPADDIFTSQCTAGKPHGEFFQTWNCEGNGVAWLDPPQLFDVRSDAAERWALDYAPSPSPPPQPGPAPKSCDATGNGTVLAHTGIPGVGYDPQPVTGSSAAVQLAACRARCCADAHCGSVTLSTSAFSGACMDVPSANRTHDTACCWLNPWGTTAPAQSTPAQENSTLAFVARSGGAPTPAPVPTPSTNPLAAVVKAMLAAVRAHNASLVGDVHEPELGKNGPVQPCALPGCADYNYPNPNPLSGPTMATM